MDISLALAQIKKILPLDDDSLKQILSYTDTLSNEAAAKHLKNLLGDSSQALDFISFYNSKRRPISQPNTNFPGLPATNTGNASSLASLPRPVQRDALPPPAPKAKLNKKKKPDFNKLPPPRQVEHQGDMEGAYLRPEETDYMAGKPSHSRKQSPQPQPKLPPSAAGKLISDPVPKKSKPTTQPTSKPSAAAPKTIKISVPGGTPMKGKSTVLNDLESVIRSLEIQTNPTLTPTAEENERRKCNCMATKHDLLEAAPNCLNCGKIICVKEGVGPCTFCGTPLLKPEEVSEMIRVLREENGREKQEAQNALHKRPEISATPRPFSNRQNDDTKLAAATQARDKLLSFQAENAKRTRIHDEAADFDVPSAGTSMWDTPQARALQLKKQQKALREMEWRARPEWERRKVVASIEVGGGKGRVVKRMVDVERPEESEESEKEEMVENGGEIDGEKRGLSRNPLLAGGGLIRPVARDQGNGKGKERVVEGRATGWRRVQDDETDNEKWILDGGLQGGDGALTGEEPACG